MSAYRVIARRAGDWWALEVPDLPGVFSQAKRLEKADDAAREAIAVMLDVEPDKIEVQVEPVLSPAAREVLQEVEQAQQATRKAADEERRVMQRAAAVLTRDLSQRDAGKIMGLSFQRVSQLLNSRSVRAKSRARNPKPRTRVSS
ncbi:type II toxin-antitoxin system HicB family antitoxin [Streptomyces sp. 7N604]|uniref:type II toxin-antitoxin system HicB family antitoxin n=1 Tax=Streptomyces sp. 7N604 TaxID=3457415 RepID=UPI003FD2551A